MQVELYHVVLKNLPDDNSVDYICGPFGTYTDARNKNDAHAYMHTHRQIAKACDYKIVYRDIEVQE